MRSMVVRQDGTCSVGDIDPEDWRGIIGNLYDMTRLEVSYLVAVVDDEGLLKNLPVTVLDAGRPLAGTAIIVRDNGRCDVTDLTDGDVELLTKRIEDIGGRRVLVIRPEDAVAPTREGGVHG